MNPNESKDPAWGLMQVVPVVRESYNKSKGTNYTQHDLLDPRLNVEMATGVLKRILQVYKGHSDKNLKPNWSNPEFIKLLTAGWNSGYSNAGGVGKVASYLEARGIPVTHDNVFRYAGAAGATQHLQTSGRQNWQRSVADLYFHQPDAPAPGESSFGGFLVGAGVAVLIGVLASKYVFK